MVRTVGFQPTNRGSITLSATICPVGEVAIISACRAEVRGSEPLRGDLFEN